MAYGDYISNTHNTDEYLVNRMFWYEINCSDCPTLFSIYAITEEISKRIEKDVCCIKRIELIQLRRETVVL
jgi:hypothetical protein